MSLKYQNFKKNIQLDLLFSEGEGGVLPPPTPIQKKRQIPSKAWRLGSGGGPDMGGLAMVALGFLKA